MSFQNYPEGCLQELEIDWGHMPRSDTDPDAPALRVPHVLCASTAAARDQWPEGSMEDIKGFLMARIISNWRKCGLEGLALIEDAGVELI
ncbi:hypothetical protein COO60DRAFT_1636575 [Scenedesmus sp. NREL 46B-D3]|nr:hypothetical protein COO60DRAFT_1636575 [Scenedesmus sp. NREL 46B-D3]